MIQILFEAQPRTMPIISDQALLATWMTARCVGGTSKVFATEVIAYHK